MEGAHLLRSFHRLEKFTLMIRIPKGGQENGKEEGNLLETAKRHTMLAIEVERVQHPEWHIPMIRFDWKKDRIDWSIHSIADSLLPENQSDIGLLYSWAME